MHVNQPKGMGDKVIICSKCGLPVCTNQPRRINCSTCHADIDIQMSQIENYYSAHLTTNGLPQKQRDSPQPQRQQWSVSPWSMLSPQYMQMSLGSRNPKEALPNNETSTLSSPRRQNGRKRALIIGVSYQNQKHKLEGTTVDAYMMKTFLESKYDFPPSNIRILVEDRADQPERIPTKENIQKGLKWLVEGCKAGDSLVFFFSGHGLRQVDEADDEIDGYDEALCPVDFCTNGIILDNDINDMIVKPLRKGVTLHAIIDASHSGTVLDLERVYSHTKQRWVDNSPPSGVRKCTSGGLAICFSACHDDQLAAETTLLSTVHDIIARASAARCLSTRLLDKLSQREFLQIPLLSSSEDFDVHSKIVTL
ncbi:hypothetical protein Nepgr_015390 [Nepenthes gracilis]|uniref:Peptidase C14 caspase domain-containing protein n=1 Tax=Nepenthes gracilis TaxID=150966 RepID=A0AAD3SMQ6_NEPGR|nr:hypothetical protein Nepgr_015390 [Nepenthes gracilis]